MNLSPHNKELLNAVFGELEGDEIISETDALSFARFTMEVERRNENDRASTAVVITEELEVEPNE